MLASWNVLHYSQESCHWEVFTASSVLQASEQSGAGSVLEQRTPVLEGLQDGLRTPPELACPSEALTHIQSQAGRAAAVAAATLDTEQTLEERAQFCELADTERRAFWVHRNAREVLCQASAEAEQQGGPHTTLHTLNICSNTLCHRLRGFLLSLQGVQLLGATHAASRSR